MFALPAIKLESAQLNQLGSPMVPRPQIWQQWQGEFFPNLSIVHQRRDFGVPIDTSKAQRETS
jgi:hypothetical protein